jgi:hypothetical protein
MMSAHALYKSGKHGVPILHDTNLDITLDRIKHAPLLRQSGNQTVRVPTLKSTQWIGNPHSGFVNLHCNLFQ